MILPDKLSQKLKDIHNKLNDQGEIFTKTQIDRFSETFRQRFNPAKLNSIDGETLLNTMHNHSNNDSLVYWLEFKNDDELPGTRFGSIGGGSALKFGIYRRKETGAWMTGSPQKQKELTIDEAAEIARKHRSQFSNGFELLEKFPVSASANDYLQLQKDMDQYAPDVSNTSWGHKYFSLSFPHKLDDYHNPNYQRFYLMKLLQMPPQEEGRYVCAGNYVTIAKELQVFIPNLTRVLSSINPRPHKYWRVGTKLGGVDSRWNIMKENSCVAVGWEEVGDLSDVEHKKEDKEKIREQIAEKHGGSPQQVGRSTQQLFNFVAVIQEGDLVIPSDGEKILGIGRFNGDYFYEPNSDAPHRRHVEWLSIDEWKISGKEGLQTTVYELKKDINLVNIEKKLFDTTSPPVIPVVKDPLKDSKLSGIQGRIQSILERKRQVIVYGPPGTGKTYWAEKTAQELASYARYNRSFGELSNDEKLIILGKDSEHKGLVRMCTFHPAYGYEDFIEGYRPTTINDQMMFLLQDGIMKKLCRDAIKNPEYKFYLIIDEINRGDIPRIFGELLTVIEKDKREKNILLSVSGEQFYVPDNLYVIGTMNTADRSIALLDTALRRRFGFIELMPDIDVLGNIVVESIPLGPWLLSLNSQLCEHIGRDARNLQIGHSYFLENGQPISSFSKFARIIQDDIIPLIEEYCYEDYDTMTKILGKNFVDEINQRIHHDLFDPAKKDDLIQALKSIDPNLDSSAPALLSDLEMPEEDQEEQSDDLEQPAGES
jgi:5-methylcytosine-specific restriction protein B